MTLAATALAIILGYIALTVWLTQVLVAFRARRTVCSAALLLLPVLLCFALPLWPRLVAWERVTIFEILFAVATLVVARIDRSRSLASVKPFQFAPVRERRVAILQLLLVTGSAIFLVPFLWLIDTSVKSDDQMASYPPEVVPRQQVMIDQGGTKHGLVTFLYQGHVVRAVDLQDKPNGETVVQLQSPSEAMVLTEPAGAVKKVTSFSPRWANYPEALQFLPKESRYGLVFLINTLIIAVLSVGGTLISSSLVAYAFARLNWPGRDIVFGILLATMMLPAAVTMMPVFLIFRALHWIDTLYPLWVPSFFGAAFNVFLLRQFFMGIPQELEDSAKIDGCSYLRTYYRIMLPQVRPALAAIAIMTFLGSWNNYLGPLIYISSPEHMPLSYALQLFQSAHGDEPGMLMAAAVLVVLPVIALFFFTQKYFIEGISLTGLGGR